MLREQYKSGIEMISKMLGEYQAWSRSRRPRAFCRRARWARNTDSLCDPLRPETYDDAQIIRPRQPNDLGVPYGCYTLLRLAERAAEAVATAARSSGSRTPSAEGERQDARELGGGPWTSRSTSRRSRASGARWRRRRPTTRAASSHLNDMARCTVVAKLSSIVEMVRPHRRARCVGRRPATCARTCPRSRTRPHLPARRRTRPPPATRRLAVALHHDTRRPTRGGGAPAVDDQDRLSPRSTPRGGHVPAVIVGKLRCDDGKFMNAEIQLHAKLYELRKKIHLLSEWRVARGGRGRHRTAQGRAERGRDPLRVQRPRAAHPLPRRQARHRPGHARGARGAARHGGVHVDRAQPLRLLWGPARAGLLVTPLAKGAVRERLACRRLIARMGLTGELPENEQCTFLHPRAAGQRAERADPLSLWSCVKLSTLKLESNKLFGEVLPPLVTGLKKLSVLSLHGNEQLFMWEGVDKLKTALPEAWSASPRRTARRRSRARRSACHATNDLEFKMIKMRATAEMMAKMEQQRKRASRSSRRGWRRRRRRRRRPKRSRRRSAKKKAARKAAEEAAKAERAAVVAAGGGDSKVVPAPAQKRPLLPERKRRSARHRKARPQHQPLPPRQRLRPPHRKAARPHRKPRPPRPKLCPQRQPCPPRPSCTRHAQSVPIATAGTTPASDAPPADGHPPPMAVPHRRTCPPKAAPTTPKGWAARVVGEGFALGHEHGEAMKISQRGTGVCHDPPDRF